MHNKNGKVAHGVFLFAYFIYHAFFRVYCVFLHVAKNALASGFWGAINYK